MKYELNSIHKWDTGETQLSLHHNSWIAFAEIPWENARKTRVFLNPNNVVQVSLPVLDGIELFSKKDMPVLNKAELNTVIATVQEEMRKRQVQKLRPFADVLSGIASIAPMADLVLKTVVSPGEKTSEGLLIEAVTIPWLEIIELLKRDPKLAFEIPPRKWEEIIAGAYKKAGFDHVILSPRSGDLGRDVIAEKRGLGTVRVIDQVKAYKPTHLVTADDVRALYGVLKADHFSSKGFLTTTSDFAPKLMDDVLIKPLIPSSLELINGKELLKRLEEIARGKR